MRDLGNTGVLEKSCLENKTGKEPKQGPLGDTAGSDIRSQSPTTSTRLLPPSSGHEQDREMLPRQTGTRVEAARRNMQKLRLLERWPAFHHVKLEMKSC